MLLLDPYSAEMQDTEKYPILDAKEQGQHYIAPAVAWRKGELPDVPEASREQAVEVLRSSNESIPIEDFDRVSAWLWPRLANPGLWQFMMDQGAHSRFFASWLMDIPGRRSMDPAWGYGYDMAGRRWKIPRDDPFYAWVIRSPAFVSFRDRSLFAANVLLSAGDAAILGCGDAPELTRTGYQFHPQDQQIYMCDIDPEVDPTAELPGAPESLGVHYQQLDYHTFLRERHEQFECIVMNGLMSYLGPILPVVNEVLPAMKSGGKFVFDLQLKHWELVRAVAVFGWPAGGDKNQLELIDGVDVAVQKVEQACRNLPVGVSSHPDMRNAEPTGVIFCITKH